MSEKNNALFNLQELFVEPTAHCNEACTMCNRWKWPKQFLDLDNLVARLEEAEKMGAKRVRFSGGEPLLHPHFQKLMDYFKSHKMHCLVYTNGLLLPNYAEELASVNAAVSVSIDGLTAETHDHIRGINGAYDNTHKGIEAFLNARKKYNGNSHISANFTVQEQNIKDLLNYRNAIDSIGVDQIRFAIIHRPGAINFNSAMYGVLRSFLEWAEKDPPKTRLLIHPQLYAIANGHISKESLAEGLPSYALFAREPLPCYVSHFSMMVAPTGDVYPCIHSFRDNEKQSADRARRIGNVCEQSLQEIWNNQPYNSFRSNTIPVRISDAKELCGICEYYFKLKEIHQKILCKENLEPCLNLNT